MQAISQLLDDAEEAWRNDLRSDYNSVWHDIPVDRSRENFPDRDWQFYTDLDTIFAEINDDAALQDAFEDTVTAYWDGDPEELARDTLHYLLFHELYHPLEAPASREDEKQLHQAIRRGILDAEPELTPEEQFAKVMAAENLVKDFILDTRFAVDNRGDRYVRDDIIPAFDVIALDGQPARTDAYTVSRYLYGVLYGPQETHDFFADKTDDGTDVAADTVEAVLDRDIEFPPTGDEEQTAEEYVAEYVQELHETFRPGNGRYDAVERLMAVLGPYVDETMENPRGDLDGVSASEGSVLEDLLEDMDPAEQNEFLEDLVDELDGDGENGDDGGGDGAGGDAPFDPLNAKQSAMHEFYRNNHPTVTLLGDGKTGKQVDAGTYEYLEPTRTDVITEDELAELDLQRIARAHQRGIPMLLPLDDDLYRLIQYEEREEPVQDVRYVDEAITVPDVVEFYLDSSGSMYDEDDGFDDGSRWDMLMHVLYGTVDAIRQASDRTGARCDVRIHNFADSQVSSSRVDADTFWDGDEELLDVLYHPENGGDTTALDIQHYPDGDDRAHVVVTDGDMNKDKYAKRQRQKLVDRDDTGEQTLLIEIGDTYNLGQAVANAGLPYRQVHDKDEMLTEGLDVLLYR